MTCSGARMQSRNRPCTVRSVGDLSCRAHDVLTVYSLLGESLDAPDVKMRLTQASVFTPPLYWLLITCIAGRERA